jgi:exodeoxyribonuclease V beta subunit
MTPLDPLTVPLQGFTLIEASAGTGKTYTITTLYVRLLLEAALDVGRILVVTYTNAATAELRTRTRRRIAAALEALEGRGKADDEAMQELAARRIQDGSAVQDRCRLLAALHGFDDSAIFTIHGFCQRVLHEHAFESGMSFDTRLINDQTALLDDIVRDFWMRELYDAPEGFVSYLEQEKVAPAALISLAAKVARHPRMPVLPPPAAVRVAGKDFSKEGLRARLLRLQLDLVEYVRAELPQRKEDDRIQFFDDLLHQLRDALDRPGGERLAAAIRSRFPAALIDEFQDTDSVQYEIFDRIYVRERGTLFVIGDPKQAIYAFRGADVFAYMAAKRAAGDGGYTLLTNRRSDPDLVRAVNAVFGRASAPFIFAAIPFRPSHPPPGARPALAGAPLRFLFAPRAGREARGGVMNKPADKEDLCAPVAGEIVRLLHEKTAINGRPITPADIAVLCRTNDQAAMMQSALRDLRVPTALLSDASVLDTEEALDVERVLLGVAEPHDGAQVRAALATPIFGLSGEDLYALRHDERAWDHWVRQFQTWRDLWLGQGFTVAFRRLLDEACVHERLLALPDGERRLTNVLHLGELLQSAAAETRRGPLRLIEWLGRLRQDRRARAELPGEAMQIRLESDARAVKLITIHKSKGLEYPVVFCPFLWDGNLLIGDDKVQLRFHDPANENRLTLDLGAPPPDAHRERAEQEALAESLRLLYVALTRAKHLCVVVWGRYRHSETSALGYLLHQPRESGSAEGLAQRTSERIKRLSDDEMLADLDALAAASGGAISVRELQRGPVEPYTPGPAAARPLVCRATDRELRLEWRSSSFSALAAAGVSLPAPAEEGIDRDEAAGELEPEPVAVGEQVLSLLDFPGGTRPGLLVHRLFELLDFERAGAEVVRDLAAQTIAAYGVDGKWIDPLCQAVAEILDTPLDDAAPPLTLRRVRRQRRLSELEFIFPVALDGTAVSLGDVTASRLADALVGGGGTAVSGGYAERVRRLSFAPLCGYLKGFIDLVFEHDGRWYVADYKSNRLGPRPEHYRPSRLLSAMEQHHYLLQYHLYTVALHRYLARRLSRYDYEAHFGGVYYLFVRGMSPRHPRGCGIFFDRPPRPLIEDLSALLAHPRRGAGT